MATCYDCIHCEACSDADDAGYSSLKEDVTKCKHFKNKADFVEVKHGKWELKSETHRYLEEIDEEFYVECPFCNRVYYVPFEFEDEKMLEYAKKNYPYCNCGAKMDGKDNKVPTK